MPNPPEPCRPLKQPSVISLVGIQNSGKTALGVRLVSVLKRMGLTVAVIKHDGHAVHAERPNWVKPGSDTEAYGDALSDITLLSGGGHSLLQTYEESIPSPSELVKRIVALSEWNNRPIDVIVIEGFKDSHYRKIAVVRRQEDVEWLRGANLENLYAVYCSNPELNLADENWRVYDETDILEIIRNILNQH